MVQPSTSMFALVAGASMGLRVTPTLREEVAPRGGHPHVEVAEDRNCHAMLLGMRGRARDATWQIKVGNYNRKKKNCVFHLIAKANTSLSLSTQE